jgi:hypothetical protein
MHHNLASGLFLGAAVGVVGASVLASSSSFDNCHEDDYCSPCPPPPCVSVCPTQARPVWMPDSARLKTCFQKKKKSFNFSFFFLNSFLQLGLYFASLYEAARDWQQAPLPFLWCSCVFCVFARKVDFEKYGLLHP